MTTLRTVILSVAVIASTSASARADTSLDNESAALHSDSPPTPIVWSFRGGMLGALNFDRLWLVDGQTNHQFNTVGLTVEAHDLKGFVAGLGAEVSWSKWEVGSSYQRPQSYYSITSSVFGTVGYSVWKSLDSRSRAWASIDVGKIWYDEDHTPAAIATVKSSNLSDKLVRLRMSYQRQITGPLALGITGGWQWAEPEHRLWDTTKRVSLSGPLIAAHLSLVSSLGRSSCSH